MLKTHTFAGGSVESRETSLPLATLPSRQRVQSSHYLLRGEEAHVGGELPTKGVQTGARPGPKGL